MITLRQRYHRSHFVMDATYIMSLAAAHSYAGAREPLLLSLRRISYTARSVLVFSPQLALLFFWRIHLWTGNHCQLDRREGIT